MPTPSTIKTFNRINAEIINIEDRIDRDSDGDDEVRKLEAEKESLQARVDQLMHNIEELSGYYQQAIDCGDNLKKAKGEAERLRKALNHARAKKDVPKFAFSVAGNDIKQRAADALGESWTGRRRANAIKAIMKRTGWSDDFSDLACAIADGEAIARHDANTAKRAKELSKRMHDLETAVELARDCNDSWIHELRDWTAKLEKQIAEMQIMLDAQAASSEARIAVIEDELTKEQRERENVQSELAIALMTPIWIEENRTPPRFVTPNAVASGFPDSEWWKVIMKDWIPLGQNYSIVEVGSGGDCWYHLIYTTTKDLWHPGATTLRD